MNFVLSPVAAFRGMAASHFRGLPGCSERLALGTWMPIHCVAYLDAALLMGPNYSLPSAFCFSILFFCFRSSGECATVRFGFVPWVADLVFCLGRGLLGTGCFLG